MSAIRPDLPAFGQTPAPSAGSAARDAQAAFFRAALDRAQAPAASPASVQAQTLSPAEVQAQPIREQRPGALLDIRV